MLLLWKTCLLILAALPSATLRSSEQSSTMLLVCLGCTTRSLTLGNSTACKNATVHPCLRLTCLRLTLSSIQNLQQYMHDILLKILNCFSVSSVNCCLLWAFKFSHWACTLDGDHGVLTMKRYLSYTSFIHHEAFIIPLTQIGVLAPRTARCAVRPCQPI